MKTKLSNKVHIISVIVFLLSLFIEMFSNYYYNFGVHYKTITENFYDKALNDYADGGVVLGSIIIIACILMIYMCVSENFRIKGKKTPKLFSFSKKLTIKNQFPITYILPVVCILCLCVYAIIIDGGKVYVSNYEYYYEYVDGSIIISFIILGFMIVNCVFDFLDSKKKKQSVDLKPVSEIPMPVTDNTNELIKLKELLDKGVITQEEFETKKKQLLDL